MVRLSHPYMTTEKIIVETMQTFVGKLMSLLFNMLSRFVIVFLLRNNFLFNFVAAVTICSDFGAQENKVCHCFYFFPFYLPWSDRTRCHDISFLNVEFKTSFFILIFHPHQETSRDSLVPLHFLSLDWYLLHIRGHWYFSRQFWFQFGIHLARHFSWCICIEVMQTS